MVYRDDFNNGVDAILVSKHHKPIWNPSTINEVNNDTINKMFETDDKKLYI